MENKERRTGFLHFKKRPLFKVISALSLAAIGHAAQAAIECDVEIQTNWEQGHQLAFTIKNTSDAAIDGWHIQLKYPNGTKVVDSWQSMREGENPATFTPPTWQPILGPEGEFIFGAIVQTPAGFKAPEIVACGEGVEVDSDEDGIPNGIDECPDTKPGVEVDPVGCPAFFINILNAPSIEVENSNFIFGSLDIKQLTLGGELTDDVVIDIDPEFKDRILLLSGPGQSIDFFIFDTQGIVGVPIFLRNDAGETSNTFLIPFIEDPDQDNDGLSNELELEIGTNPRIFDTDRDGLSDGEEVNATFTDPLNPDTDGGGTADGRELRDGTDPLNASDDVITLPASLTDGSGFNWQISSDGTVAGFSTGSFGTAFASFVANAQAPLASATLKDRTAVVSFEPSNDLKITRKIMVPEAIPGIRYIDTVTNIGNVTRTIILNRRSDLGSRFGSPLIHHTGSGDVFFDADDSFIVTSAQNQPPISSVPSSSSEFSISSSSFAASQPEFSSSSFIASQPAFSSSSIIGSESAFSSSPLIGSEPESSSFSFVASEPLLSSASLVSSEPSTSNSSPANSAPSFSSSSSVGSEVAFSTSSFTAQSSFTVQSSSVAAPSLMNVFAQITQGHDVNGLSLKPSSGSFVQGQLETQYRYELRPGESLSLVSVGVVTASTDEALALADQMQMPTHEIWQDLTPLEALNIKNLFSTVDSDNDGLLDDQELILGTNPFIAQSQQSGVSDLEFVVTEAAPERAGDLDNDGVLDFADRCIAITDGEVGADGCLTGGAQDVITISGVKDVVGVEQGNNITAVISFDDIQFEGTLVAGARIDLAATNNAFIQNRRADGSIEVLIFNTTSNLITLPIFISNGTFISEPVDISIAIDRPDPRLVQRAIINSAQAINASNISLTEVFDLLASEGEQGSGIDLFRQLWDAQLTESAIGSNINCGPINGFDLVCDRDEAQVALFNDAEIDAEMNNYEVLAFINRLELRNHWEDCGEHRVIFGRQPNFSSPSPLPLFGRNFVIVEARIPNPTPGDIQGCRAFIEQWDTMAQLNETEQGEALREMFIDGLPGHAPVVNVNHLVKGMGQIRTNQFMRPEWLLREYDLENRCDNDACRIVALPVRVNENPGGELFSPFVAMGDDELALKAQAFQEHFAADLSPLLKTDAAMLSNPVAEEFNNGQSHASSRFTLENDFNFHFAGGFETPFGESLRAQLEGKVDALGNPLTVEQLLNRATAMTCGGCHQPSTFGLTIPNSIGAFELPNGTIINSWPNSNGFVHVDEQRRLSPALQQVFIPSRLRAFDQALDELNTISVLAIPEPSTAPRINPKSL